MTRFVKDLFTHLLFLASKPIARHFARGYESALRERGLAWTLELVDEDIGRYGNRFVHQLAKAGVVLLAEDRCFLAVAECPGCKPQGKGRTL